METSILSFDANKVRLCENNGRKYVEKATSFKEYWQMSGALDYLQRHPFSLYGSSKFTVRVAPIIGWSALDRLLTTAFCEGLNGESILRLSSGEERTGWLSLMKIFLSSSRRIGFLWGDCAPRNIIIQPEVRSIWLVDFERGLSLLERPAGESEFSNHIRNYAREEFSCFLTKSEQGHFFSGLLIENLRPAFPASSVKSKRKRQLLRSMFGAKEIYAPDEIRQAENIMVEAATPINTEGNMFFPMDIIDRISNTIGVQCYADVILRLHRHAADPKERVAILKEF